MRKKGGGWLQVVVHFIQLEKPFPGLSSDFVRLPSRENCAICLSSCSPGAQCEVVHQQSVQMDFLAEEATEVQKGVELDQVKRGTQVEAQGSWHSLSVVGAAKLSCTYAGWSVGLAKRGAV